MRLVPERQEYIIYWLFGGDILLHNCQYQSPILHF